MSDYTDDELLARFVETFRKLDDVDHQFTHEDPPPDELNSGANPNDWRYVMWRPAPLQAGEDALQLLYHRLPANLPPLYERLITSWRWLEVFLYRIRLLANPPGPEFTGLASNIFKDPTFERHLIGNGFIPFGFYSGENGNLHLYDPVCFDTKNRDVHGDCPIVGFGHEAMLTNNRIGDTWRLWDSFRDLVVDTVEYAKSRP